MPWTGDLGAMGELSDRVGDLAGVPSRIAARVADELTTLVQDEFNGEHDPYGVDWQQHAEATVQRWGAHPILDLTGDMRRSAIVRTLPGAGVALTIDHPGAPHQTGWSGPQGEGPARPVLPGREMPPDWQEAIDVATEQEFGKMLR